MTFVGKTTVRKVVVEGKKVLLAFGVCDEHCQTLECCVKLTQECVVRADLLLFRVVVFSSPKAPSMELRTLQGDVINSKVNTVVDSIALIILVVVFFPMLQS